MNHHPFRHRAPLPKWLLGLVGTGSLFALSLAPEQALADGADVSPPAPDVLLLVDTSGSMDYKTSSNTFPKCHFVDSSTAGPAAAEQSERSRWIDLVEVLTGSIAHYDCQRIDRNSAAFKNEYKLGAANPYDFLYPNPYNRPVSKDCVAGPGTLDVNPALFPSTSINYHKYNDTGLGCSFEQSTDGILDAFQPDVRFGLMTFDTEPRPAKDMGGLWSYYLNGTSAQGEPVGCSTMQDQEVGVRNTDAPPWEGRAVGFGNPVGATDYQGRNSMIQQILLATRPYGATPIAGMLSDARDYMLNDTSADPLNAAISFGPKDDPAKACRHQAIVLLSDGQPNMDLRPFCEGMGATCPYKKAEDIAADLKSKGIEIYVIGFALTSVTVGATTRSCASFGPADFNDALPSSTCKDNPNDQAIQACCALNRIAAAGGHAPTSVDDPDWTHAHFADNRDQLRSELSQAIGGSFKTTTRTPFVNATGSGFINEKSDLTFARSLRFSASFKPGKLDKPWIGQLDRSRYKCVDDGTGVKRPTLQSVDSAAGDRFVDNVNYAGPQARKIFTLSGATAAASNGTMRPNLTTGVVDGVGTVAGTMNTTFYTSAQFVANISAAAMGVTDTMCDSTGVDLDADACHLRYLKWLVGLDNGTPYNRCPAGNAGGENCNLISEFYHSVPKAVAGRPSQFLVDQSYTAFVTTQTLANRPAMLYASSNDGFLHAFKILEADRTSTTEPIKVKTRADSNELWTFVPPGVLPGIPKLYPASHQRLLDGTPSIKDVVATIDQSKPSGFRLERTLDQARGGSGSWRTILVQSFGAQRPGYFAIDVTDPVLANGGGPKFLWQLVTDSAGAQLFGSGGGTPLITTVYLDGKEVAVAILPGGYASEDLGSAGPSSTGCARAQTSYPDITETPRVKVPCYTKDEALRARSLTVVRLDSGEIIRTFRRAKTEVPGLVDGVITEALIDSPMTGQPVAYPANVGSVADRIFIGDQDGTMWRLNLASALGKPSEWALELFFDGFPNDGTAYTYAWNAGQPIISTPIISVDRTGNLTVAFSTGEQEAVGADPTKPNNYVWSLTEKPSADRKKLNPKLNWNLKLGGGALAGDRVIGEMALFNGDLFFATVGPGGTDACSSGSGKVWGMHYLDPNPAGVGLGGKLSSTLTTLVGANAYIDATTLLGSDAHAYLSGVNVAQQPTCDAGDEGDYSYGMPPASGTVTQGKYQLIIPTGDKVSTSTTAGITPIANGVAIDLKQPPTSLIVDSWASIVE
jgi:type IV pilus assembly protein PilY1